MIDAFADRNLNNYIPENGAVYPNTTLGRQVSHAAQVLKDDVSFLGVELVTMDTGGYDTHANQLTAANPVNPNQGHASLLSNLALSMEAFNQDMGPTRMQDTMFLVVSEFGSLINADADWPGLAPGDLDGGNLDWATDFRDIYWEILSTHMGVDNTTLEMVIPGHTYSPVGFTT